MLLLLALPLLVTAHQPARRTMVRDSTRPDTFTAVRRAVTPELRASAFRDAEARRLFERARDARIAQDSTLRSYDAKVAQRFTVRAAMGRIGPERLAWRQESAGRVRWERGIGAHIEVTGGRVSLPALGMPDEERVELRKILTNRSTIPIPYFPGHETLWIGEYAASPEVNEESIINPLADGAEAYYTFRTGDSLRATLGDGRTLTLRELEVRPRNALPNVMIGSFWVDVATGHLVRAAYRPAAEARAVVSVSASGPSDGGSAVVNSIIKALMPSSRASVSTITIEYQLYNGYWLPRSQRMEGLGVVSLARVPVVIENAFSYTAVNAGPSLAPIEIDPILLALGPSPSLPAALASDTAARRRWRDSVSTARSALQARVDSIRKAQSRQCDSAATRIVTDYQPGGRVPIQLRIPCDLDLLMTSPDLPRTAYDPGEEIFGSRDRAQLIADALSLTVQAPFSVRGLFRPQFRFGTSMTRYNRIEGLSTGIGAFVNPGGGLDAAASVRIGGADRVLNAEMSVGLTDQRRSLRAGAYSQLVAANDWENPLSFGASLSAFFFGRDDGFYYRATGADFRVRLERAMPIELRGFAERQSNAAVRADFSVAGSFAPNIEAASGWFTGGSLRAARTFGLDPRGFRFLSDVRVEGATGDATFGRGALDLTLRRPIAGLLDVALTAAGGTSVGDVPAQRRWFLGGTATVRGQRPDTAQSGNAFWLGRLEVAHPLGPLRPSLFGDVGWVGNRTTMGRGERPMSGVGIGLGALDGAVRLDIARGLYPREQTRVTLTFGARY